MFRITDNEEQVVHFGGKRNPDKTFYVIRFEDDHAWGLLMCFQWVMAHVRLALERRLIPVVDMENYHGSYREEEPINGTRNVWEYFWKQPGGVSLEEAYGSRNIVLSPRLDLPAATIETIRYLDSDEMIMDDHNLIATHMQFNETTLAYAGEYCSTFPRDGEILGVISRGSDYNKTKPIGAASMLSPELLLELAKAVMHKHNIKYCFLATEEKKVLEMFLGEFGSNLIWNPESVFFDDIFTPKKNESLLSQHFHKIERQYPRYAVALNYLTNVIALSRCQYFLGSVGATGGRIAILLNGCRYIKRYPIYLGRYVWKIPDILKTLSW